MTDSDEEEEILVYSELEEGTFDKDTIKQLNVPFKIIGLDTETPIAQLGKSTFKGSWEETIGTKLIFEVDPSPEPVDPAFTVSPKISLQYKGQTRQILKLSKIFLTPKSNEGMNSSAQNDSTDLNEQTLDLSSGNDLKVEDASKEI